ncbi:MAG: hypothetical protein J4415_02495 [Candidatus Diapherotrites archaeon]|uniref:Uncharacterized protein n=1 Tax=Candidatus Iainarchaeum sp. TaxID=3101447 RepID=A0A8T4L0W0_9ARCH|nr:hypothetical protein [Candidatus Diapherotrites archaeon]
MATDSAHAVGMFLIGLGVGTYLPEFPAPINIINPYFGLILMVIGIVVFLRG